MMSAQAIIISVDESIVGINRQDKGNAFACTVAINAVAPALQGDGSQMKSR